MSGYKSFAIVGGLGANTPASAAIGATIAKEFLRHGYEVKILARKSSASKLSAERLISLGAKIVTIDYSNPTTIQFALQGIDVVISALGGSGIALQGVVAEAAAKAGVKLFVPSEYGVSTLRATPDLAIYGKRQIHDKLRELGLPFALFFVGGFNSYLYFFIQVKDGHLLQVGDENTLFSFTSEKNVAEFIFRALTRLSPSRLSNAIFHIAGTTGPLSCYIDLIQRHRGLLNVVKITVQEAKEKFRETGDPRFAVAMLVGMGVGNTESTDRDLFEDIKWDSIDPTLEWLNE